MLIKTEGVVIRTRDYGESHKLVWLFTREQGKVSVMARGAKKPKSRFSAVTQPFTHGEYVWFSGGSGLPTLSQADLIHAHHLLRSDLEKTAIAAYLSELLDRLTEEKEPHPHMFALWTSTLSLLETETDADILRHIFELKVLEMAGYRPYLDGCTRCKRAVLPVRFSVRHGGFLCLDCASHDPASLPLSEASARILKLLQRAVPDRLGEVRVKEETKQQLDNALRAFIDEYVPVRLRSRAFLDQMRGGWGRD